MMAKVNTNEWLLISVRLRNMKSSTNKGQYDIFNERVYRHQSTILKSHMKVQTEHVQTSKAHNYMSV